MLVCCFWFQNLDAFSFDAAIGRFKRSIFVLYDDKLNYSNKPQACTMECRKSEVRSYLKGNDEFAILSMKINLDVDYTSLWYSQWEVNGYQFNIFFSYSCIYISWACRILDHVFCANVKSYIFMKNTCTRNRWIWKICLWALFGGGSTNYTAFAFFHSLLFVGTINCFWPIMELVKHLICSEVLWMISWIQFTVENVHKHEQM